MGPDSIFVQNLAKLPMAPGLHIHSIIPVEGTGSIAEGDDGVVKYSSAHIEPVDSELVVRFGHSCQNEPKAIIELRRIMRLHLAELQTSAAPKN